jgi:CoA-transferase family III
MRAIVRQRRTILSSPLPVGELAIDAVTRALVAAAELAHARGPTRPSVTLDAAHVEAAFTSERHLRRGGQTVGPSFAPLSTWLQTRDGWIRTHANYPHHRAALIDVLGAGDDIGAVKAAAARRGAEELEDAIFAAGGCAGALRDHVDWVDHPAGRALAGRPMIEHPEGPPGASPLPALRDGELPAAGVRVLDLTRVIAGPVAGRTLAALGADVLRIDAPGAVELEGSILDGGLGKRWARLDLRSRGGARVFDDLLREADVLLDGYRPGALAALGFGMSSLAERYPKLVTVSLSAWGEEGPWGTRRGFDSLVQAATGIADRCTAEGDATPGALPAQALDHGTGHLMAAAALFGLTARTTHGRSLHSRLALARTAARLLDLQADPDLGPPGERIDPAPYLIDVPYGTSTVTVVAPPGELDGRALRWERAVEPIDRASWR